MTSSDEARHDSDGAVQLATFEKYRGLLFSVAYRMLGSVADAEDMLQETYIRWQGATGEEIRDPRAFLVTITSRLCISQLQSARVRREEYVGQWLPEPIVAAKPNDPMGIIRMDESLSTAFLVLLEKLTPVERAVFLLREVFEYDYSEISKIVSENEVNCRQVFSRARRRVNAMRPRFEASAQDTEELLETFVKAVRGGQMEKLLALLAKDVTLYSDGGGKAVAVPNPIHGAHNVARGILAGFKKLVPRALVQRMAWVNGKPGLVGYFNGKPFSVITLGVADGQVHAIYIVTSPEKLDHLPDLPNEHSLAPIP